MKNLKIYFDGILQSLNDFDGTESISLVFRKKTEGGESAFSFAPELTVTGNAYLYVKQQIISAPNPNVAAISVEIYDTCCLDDNGDPRLIFTGKIEGSDVRWCTVPACEAQVTVIDNSQDAEAIRCLKNHFPWDTSNNEGTVATNGYNTYRYAPDIPYCTDVKPSALQETVLILGIVVISLSAGLILVLSVLSFILNLDINILNSLSGFINGCNKKKLAPFIDSQLRNLCLLCNLNYQSSLFEIGGYYHNTVRMDMGFYQSQSKTEIQTYEDNKPNLNGMQFLDFFKQFNIDWRISNGSLIVERKDFFSGGEWFNLDNLNEDQILSICWDSTGEKPAAYAEYLYGKDGVDASGDEVLPKWVDRVIDWNPANNQQQSGLFQRQLTVGAAQFRADYNASDINPIDKNVYQGFYSQDPMFYYAMFLTRGTAGFPKLINLQSVTYDLSSTPNTLINRGFGTPDNFTIGTAVNNTVYNYKWHIKEVPYSDGFGNTYDTAYQTLFNIDDPRATTVKTRKITITITADCDLITTMSVDKYITTADGQVEVQEITYDTNNNSLTINGLI